MTGFSDRQGRLIYLVSEDWYFVSHRLQLAVAAKEAGYEVCVITRVRDHGQEIHGAGLRLVPLEMSRARLNPIHDLKILLRLVLLYRREQPSIVHHVALKPVVLGSIAAWVTGVKSVVNALAGLGYVFTAKGIGPAILRSLIKLAFKTLFRSDRVRVVVQNDADGGVLKAAGVPSKNIVLIAGSGVDIEKYQVMPEPRGPIVIAMVSRMIWPKGVRELVEAGRILKTTGRDIRILLVGAPDPDNPSSIDVETLESWTERGSIEWLGPIPGKNVPGIWRDSHIGVLPSYYGEGVPKTLLEAAACGRPLVTSDIPGCRDVVVHEKTGLLVPPRDASALAAAIIRLADDPERRVRFGKAGRARVEAQFSLKKIVTETLVLYESLRISA